jgi:monomeric isocitrate dehydrogenase
MTINVDHKLAELAVAIRSLPEDVQADVLADIEIRVSRLARSLMTGEQREIIKRRLAVPRDYVDDGEVAALLRRFSAPA